MYFTTENVGLLCLNGDVDMTAPISGLFMADQTWPLPAPITTLATDMGLFGDGMAFDADGNLYAIFDAVDVGSYTLEESALWVLPCSSHPTKRFGVRWDQSCTCGRSFAWRKCGPGASLG